MWVNLMRVYFCFFAVLQSKRFVQILMSEDVDTSLFSLMILENIFKTNRSESFIQLPFF